MEVIYNYEIKNKIIISQKNNFQIECIEFTIHSPVLISFKYYDGIHNEVRYFTFNQQQFIDYLKEKNIDNKFINMLNLIVEKHIAHINSMNNY